MRVVLLLMLVFFIVGQNSAETREAWNSKSSLAVLPQYCKDNAARDGSFEKWRTRLGKAWHHMHHYCKGLWGEYKARGTIDRKSRDHYLFIVVSQMRYVSDPCQVGCVLYPELHSRWGWALGEQGQVSEAIKHYELAIKAKNNYSKAYAGLSDLYVKINQQDEARKVLEAGLKARPGSRRLQRKLQKLVVP